jgi:uncharacterized protein (DUF2164 family)
MIQVPSLIHNQGLPDSIKLILERMLAFDPK